MFTTENYTILYTKKTRYKLTLRNSCTLTGVDSTGATIG